MAVALDTFDGTGQDVSSATSINYTGITVGSGSNRALALLFFFETGNPTGISVTWDNGGTNQAMSQLVAFNSSTGSAHGYIYGLRNPISGNKTARISWTGATDCHVSAISFTGVDQTSDAAAFPHTNNGSGTSSSPAVTLTSATGNMCVNAMTVSDPGTATVNQTKFVADTNTAIENLYGAYASGAASVTFTWTLAGSFQYGIGALDIAAASGSGVTGTLAVTEASDVAFFAGNVLVSGTLASTDTTDTAAFNGSVLVSGTLAVTETTDTAAFNGFVGVSGSLIATDVQDTAAFNGGVLVSGTLAVTEVTDTASFNGDVIVSGTLVVTEDTDTAAFNGTVGNVISGTLAVTETPDIAAFAGSVLVSGTLSTTEIPDIAAFNGGVLVSGTFAVTEGLDTAVFSGIVASTISGTFAVTEAPDIAFFTDALAGGGRWHWLDGYKARKHTSPAADVKAAAAVLSKMGGIARAKSLTATQRSNIASTAAKARWK